MTCNIDNLTLGQIKELKAIFGSEQGLSIKSHPFKNGENYFIRTVTMIVCGKLEAVHDTELLMSSASWIADTGRFHDALKTGTLNEVEPFIDDVIIGRGSIIDATIWAHKLPKDQK